MIKNNIPAANHDVVLISKAIINASYDFTETQENVLTKVCAHLAQYTGTDKADLRTLIEAAWRDTNGIIYEISNTTIKEVSNNKNIKSVREDILKLESKDFAINYTWKDDDGTTWKRSITLFNSITTRADGKLCF